MAHLEPALVELLPLHVADAAEPLGLQLVQGPQNPVVSLQQGVHAVQEGHHVHIQPPVASIRVRLDCREAQGCSLLGRKEVGLE